MRPSKKYSISFSVVLLALTQPLYGAGLPVGHNPQSTFTVDYSDLDAILKGSVLDMGPSTHKPAVSRRIKLTGTRLQIGNTKVTNEEGNRLFVHAFEEPERAYLREMRDQLLAIPSTLPLENLTRNEQLAYWFNLHNAIVLSKISDEYPVTYLAPFFDQGKPKAFINQRQFDLNGEWISLSDIQLHVLTNWRNPVVIYGFYMGAIGTPNIRTSAYKGHDVYDQLEENAVDFVNSMRGTQIWKRGELKVSSYYKRMEIAFPNFENSVRTHIEQYASDKFKRRLLTISSINPGIEDWNIADLMNGNLSHPSGSRQIVTAYDNGPSGAPSFKSVRLPPHAIKLLRRRISRNAKRTPTVDIEELPTEKDPE